MKKLILCLGILCINISFSQNSFTAILKGESDEEPLIGARAVVEGTSNGAVADIDGKLTIQDIPDGVHVIVFSYINHETREETYEFPLAIKQPVIIYLEGEEELETVTVNATRSSRTIDDIPTRVEVVGSEELGEKAIMNSTNIAMILRESTGIQIQQTSANSANQQIRIQGLDGRYTQLLKDGFPLYSGFSGGLSVMQIPPLDLTQVELVKGSSSTLYGGGAIAGLVNLVSKQPDEESPELTFMLNQTSALGTTANAFWSQRFEKVGFTLYTSGTNQVPYDPNKDDFSDIPQIRSVSVNPKFFWYPTDSTKLWFGVNTAYEDRLGGDLQVIEGSTDSLDIFSEQNLSKRAATQLHFEHQFSKGGILTARNSFSYFDRGITIPNWAFMGEQLASFSEVNWSKEKDKTDWIIGANLVTDRFTENTANSNVLPRGYEYLTTGVFAQNNLDLGEKFVLESGMRVDYNTDFGFFPLPRLSLLAKPTEKLTARLGGGMGYKLPTIFNEEAEVLTFQNINPIDIASIKPENSLGGNFDFNYKTVLGEKVTMTINQLFFYTQLTNSLVLEPDANGSTFNFANAGGNVVTKGAETNVKFTLGDFKLFLQYAYADVDLLYNNVNNQKPLTPRHNAGAIFMFEQEEKWRIGYEIYYTGEQIRTDYTKTQDYVIMGFMLMRQFERLSLFLNFENFTDTRQSRYQSMIIAPDTDPSSTDIWAPTDGIVVNGGLIFKLYGEDE